MSYAGVARRTTRPAVVAGSAAAGAYAYAGVAPSVGRAWRNSGRRIAPVANRSPQARKPFPRPAPCRRAPCRNGVGLIQGMGPSDEGIGNGAGIGIVAPAIQNDLWGGTGMATVQEDRGGCRMSSQELRDRGFIAN
jgi:hypothetical protein